MCPLLRGLPRRSPSNRRNTKKPPHASALRAVIERLETRAMLAGVGPESWSAPGLAPAPLGTGSLFSSGIILTCSNPTPGSSGTSSPPAPTSGSGGTTSGGDLWLAYSGGSGAGGSTSGSTGGVSTNGPALSSQYNGGSGAGGQGNGTGGTPTNADLWRLYWSGAGAGSSPGSDNGSLADDPTISAQYTGGSGIGHITPLVYNPQSDGPPVFHSGVWTGDEGGVQFVQTADTGSGQDGGDPPAGRPTWNDAQDDYYASRWLFEVEAGMGMYDPRKKEPKPADSDTTADAPSDQSAGASPNVDGISQTEELPVARAETKKFLADTAKNIAIASVFATMGRRSQGGPASNPAGGWKSVPESMSDRARAYQQQITGRAGQAYFVDGVKFDGIAKGILIDAKGPGYATFVYKGIFRDFFRGADELVDQAQRQLRAANGNPIRWHIAEEDAVTAIRNLFADRGITGIIIVLTPIAP